MKKTLLILMSAFLCAGAYAQDKSVTFTFKAGDAMFYNTEVPGNAAKLQELFDIIDRHRTTIDQVGIRINVDAYSTSGSNEQANKNLSFVRANRVKSELIEKKGIKEEYFSTRNLTTAYNGQGDVVVVTLHLPQIQPVPEVTPETKPESKPEPVEPEPKPEFKPVVEQPTQIEIPQTASVSKEFSRWSLGVNVGVPMFWGDFVSFSADKTYIGVMGGLQASYNFTNWLGVTLSADYGQGKTGSREYANDYLLGKDGMTHYTPQSSTTAQYKDLYSTVSFFSVGLSPDVNLTRLFSGGKATRVSLLLSPTVYAQKFSPTVYTKADDKQFTDGSLKNDWSIGLGGSASVRYSLNSSLDLQLKGGAIWVMDNNFDGVATVGQTKQNAMGFGTLGIIWKLKNKK